MSADMDCESLLLEDDVHEKCSDGSDFSDMCNADEDALLADDDALVTTKPKPPVKSRLGVRKGARKPAEQESEDVLDIGNVDVELDELESPNKNNLSLMTVSSTTSVEGGLSTVVSDKHAERETRFKQERHVTNSKKYSNIPDSLDDVVVPNYSHNNNNQRNQRPFRGRGGGGYNNNNQRNKPEGKTVLINPHFRGKVNVSNNNKGNWDARYKLNQNSKNQVGHVPPPLVQQNFTPDNIWNNMQSVPVQQLPPQQQFQQYIPPQVPQQQMYAPPPSMPMQHLQVPQQYPQYQPPQQCFIQPMDSFYSQPPQFHHAPQFNQQAPPYQQSVPQFPPDPNQYSGRMMTYNNPHFVNPQNQVIPPDGYGQQHFNPHIPQQQIQAPMFNQIRPHHQTNNPQNSFQMSNLKRKTINPGGLIRKNKKRNQVLSTNLHEVRTIQTPDTTVKDEEDDDTREYRRGIEEQKRQRELLLQQKEARRRQALHGEQNQETGTTFVQPKLPVIISKNIPTQKPPVSKLIVQTNPNVVNVPIRKVTPNATNSNIKVVNVSNEPNVDKQHLSSFLTNRKILAKDESLLDTNIVLISNLANGTTSVKLHKMCVGIGDVKNLQMSPKERQATIQFNSVASAHAFFKKYRRTMLDLSVINVTLKPTS